MAGDPFPPSVNIPPAITPEFFKQLCPNPTIIGREEVNGPLPGASAATIFQTWLDKLEQIEDRCVEIRTDTWPVFDFWCVFLPSPCSAGAHSPEGIGYLVNRPDCSIYGLRSSPRQL